MILRPTQVSLFMVDLAVWVSFPESTVCHPGGRFVIQMAFNAFYLLTPPGIIQRIPERASSGMLLIME